jgi:putative PIN family toxin of toxin-antitoxin system
VIRAVIDTSVLVSAFIGGERGAPARVVQAVRERRIILIMSPRAVAELSDVLQRPKFGRWASDGRGEAYAAGLAAVAEHHPDDEVPAPATSDPDDDYLVALATRSAARLIASLDGHLLEADIEVEVVRPECLLERLQDP